MSKSNPVQIRPGASWPLEHNLKHMREVIGKADKWLDTNPIDDTWRTMSSLRDTFVRWLPAEYDAEAAGRPNSSTNN